MMPRTARLGLKALRRRPCTLASAAIAAWTVVGSTSPPTLAQSGDLTDLAGTATVIVTPKDHDNFSNNELRYEITIKNDSAEPLATDQLIVVLDRITNLAGSERDPLKGAKLVSLVELLEKDGETPDGKPYFRLPASQGPELAPHSSSQPILVRFRNNEYTPIYPPSFRVLGQRKASPSSTLDTLVDLLIKKGVLTDDEWQAASRGIVKPKPPAR